MIQWKIILANMAIEEKYRIPYEDADIAAKQCNKYRRSIAKYNAEDRKYEIHMTFIRKEIIVTRIL